MHIRMISKSVADLNKKMQVFFDTFTNNQGLKLTEKQSKMLVAFEILNRSEQRLAVLNKLKIDLVEKQSDTRIRLARIEFDIRDENVDRSVAVNGTLNGDDVRNARRTVLTAERNNTRALLLEIQKKLSETDDEINQTERLKTVIRPKLFAEIESEINDL